MLDGLPKLKTASIAALTVLPVNKTSSTRIISLPLTSNGKSGSDALGRALTSVKSSL